MILCFSGTGNSRAVAGRLALMTGERLSSFTDTPPLELEFEGNSLGLVFPVYSWGVPPLVLSFTEHLTAGFKSALGKRPVWMVCTCGDETALAPEMLKKSLHRAGLSLAGGWSVAMPNNYVLLPGFDVDSSEVERQKLQAFPARVDAIAECVNAGRWEEDYVRGSAAWAKTRLVYPLFKRWGVFPSRWRATDECVSCGRCAAVCPVGNITMDGGRPRWGRRCESCLACYHVCPRHAVQYGRATERKGQYRHFFKS